jgi:hypothetical protein
VQPLIPAAGIDASWQAGLALAQEHGLHFGSDIVFTYGPLGFLTASPLFVVWSGMLAVAFSLLLQVLLCRTLLHVLRDLPAAGAVMVAYVVAAIGLRGAELGLMIVLALTLSVLAEPDAHPPRWLPASGGVAASALLLIKPNVGVLALALTAIAVVFCAPRRGRALAELAGSFVVAFAVVWLATGNAVRDVVPWLRGSAQFVAGYTAGMAFEDPGRHHEIVDAVLLFVAMALLLRRAAAGQPRARQAALALACAIGSFAMLKEGFVRHDAHAAIFFATCAVVAAALARGELTRIAGAGIAVIASVWSLASFGVQPSALVHYTDRLDGTAAELKLLTDGAARNEMLSETRAQMLRTLGLPPGVLRDLRSHTVDVQPTETSAVWTLGFHWRPQPVFQSYAVLTPALDRLNADFLASERAPERVLRLHPLSNIDERNPVFDAPSAFLALVCNYRETFVSGGFEVLARATNRCGPPRRFAGRSVQAGQDVHVPRARPHELVYARVRIPRPFADRLRELVWKPAAEPAIELDGVSFRLVAATASGPLLMRMPSSAGFPASGLRDTQVDTFRLTGVTWPVQVDFYALRVG